MPTFRSLTWKKVFGVNFEYVLEYFRVVSSSGNIAQCACPVYAYPHVPLTIADGGDRYETTD